MAIIKSSSKLARRGGEYLLSSGTTVFFRLVDEGDELQFMTATADEDDRALRAYRSQEELIRHTTAVLEEKEYQAMPFQDRQGRPYVLALIAPEQSTVEHLAATILDRLGIDGDISVQAVREMRAIHDEFSTGDDEETYLSDGVSITSDGQLIDRK